jgi:ATP-dependent DNA helicase RecG
MSSGPTIDVPLAKVVGDKTAKGLADPLGLHTVGDLVYHFPRRYDERGQHTEIRTLQVGEQVTVLAQVHTATVRKIRNGTDRMLEVSVGDGSGGRLGINYFGAKQTWRERDLLPGRWGMFAGTVGEFRGKRQLTFPEYVMLDGPDGSEIEEFAGALIPIYPASKNMPTWTIGRCVRVLLDTFVPPEDPLPSSVRAERKLIGLADALREIHRPSSREYLGAAKKRLKWDEAFAVQVRLVQRKTRAAVSPATPRPRRPAGILERFEAALPYELTGGQVAVGVEIANELAGKHPMHRLLQGEVGSGKTLCAVRAMLQVVDAGGQAAMLAPTEVLATQHFRSLAGLLGPLGRAGELDGDPDGTRVALLTGSLSAPAKRAVLAEIADGTAGVVVGTHALLYDSVEFAELGLVVVDEQHRFGVEQRDALRAKSDVPPHVLVMTATPIPRTVAMTVYGDLDVSILAELPRGRSPIATHVVPAAEKPAFLDRAWRRLREEVEAGHQAYIVCPRIGTGSGSDEEVIGEETRRPPIAVTEIAPLLLEGPLRGLRVGVLHGRLPSDEKDAVMRAFSAGEIDVLIATTVIEVGVDVPNATVMIVLDAERFGVSQLHQLRGRVGRGSAPGLCLLVTEAPEASPARERLDAVASTLDGFRLAEIDLEARREGDVLGATQSGRHSHLQLLSVLRDADLITEARAAAIALIADDPDLDRHPALRDSIAVLVDEDRAEYLEKG